MDKDLGSQVLVTQSQATFMNSLGCGRKICILGEFRRTSETFGFVSYSSNYDFRRGQNMSEFGTVRREYRSR